MSDDVEMIKQKNVKIYFRAMANPIKTMIVDYELDNPDSVKPEIFFKGFKLIAGHLEDYYYKNYPEEKPNVSFDIEEINKKIKELDEKQVAGLVSDGYHTFDELYEHRHALFATVVYLIHGWKSKLHNDGTIYNGWFIAGVDSKFGQISYHLPEKLWDKFPARELKKAPKWDGHTSDDVIVRLWKMIENLDEKM